MDREAWHAAVPGDRKEWDTTEKLNWTELNNYTMNDFYLYSL